MKRSPLTRKTRLAPRSAKRAAYLASDEGKAGLAHMARVRALPCVICAHYGEPQLSATQAHHCIHDRHGFRRAPDTDTTPLCEGHHLGQVDTSKLALHAAPSKWRRLYGPDHSWLPVVAKMLDG